MRHFAVAHHSPKTLGAAECVELDLVGATVLAPDPPGAPAVVALLSAHAALSRSYKLMSVAELNAPRQPGADSGQQDARHASDHVDRQVV